MGVNVPIVGHCYYVSRIQGNPRWYLVFNIETWISGNCIEIL